MDDSPIKDENAATHWLSRLVRDLDQNAARAIARNEMWAFSVDIGGTTEPEPPPSRRPKPVVVNDSK